MKFNGRPGFCCRTFMLVAKIVSCQMVMRRRTVSTELQSTSTSADHTMVASGGITVKSSWRTASFAGGWRKLTCAETETELVNYTSWDGISPLCVHHYADRTCIYIESFVLTFQSCDARLLCRGFEDNVIKQLRTLRRHKNTISVGRTGCWFSR
jgi:hypothetical protein